MSDPMAMLDMEKRTGIKNSDVDDFLKKATALESAISGIKDGSLDPAKVSLKKYGILTEEEQAEEDARRLKNKLEMAARVAKEKAAEKIKEREKWWDGAEYMYGPRIGSDDYNEEQEDKNAIKAAERLARTKEEQEKLVNRYSMDYSRWNSSNYTPDDEASKEEVAKIEAEEDEKKMLQFESTNSEWCGAQKEDMDKRQKMREKKEKTAVSCRLKGNNYFKARKYEKALEQYMEALNEQGYKSNILTNIIQAQVKLKNYEDALEFCDRALHVDRDNVKALSRRAHVFVEACDQSSKGKVKVARIKALQDLERALSIEPENEAIIKQKTDLSQQFQDEEMELRVKQMVLDEEKRVKVSREVAARTALKTSSSSSSPSSASEEKKDDKEAAAKAWMEKSMEKIARGEQFDAPPVSEFEMVDQMFDKIATNEIGSSFMPEEAASGTAALPSLFGFDGNQPKTNADLLKMALEESEENRVYLRSSGKLDTLCARLMLEEHESERCHLFALLAAACKAQKKNREIVYEKMGLAAAVACLYDDKQTIANRIGASSLLNEGMDEAGGVSAKCVSLICGDVGIIVSLSKLLYAISLSSEEDISAEVPLNFLRDLAKNDKTKQVITAQLAEVTNFLNGEEHPVGATVLAMTAKNATSAVREAAVGALSNLALSPKMRTSFCVTVQTKDSKTGAASGVQALLAVARAHKTETPAARTIALGTLMNAAIDTERKAVEVNPEEANDANGVKREIAHFGGLPVLIALISSEKDAVSPLPIKQRAAGLLSRCMGNPKCSKAVQEDSQNGAKVATQFVKFVMQQKQPFNVASENKELAESVADTATQLVRVLAGFSPAPASVSGYVASLVALLPQPQTDKSDGDRVNAKSVCMPPVKTSEVSCAHFAHRDSTLIANALKCMIQYLDSGSVESVLAAGGLERLICCLANNNMFKTASVRKNAAAAMARIVKADPKAMARCRELRGMEILVELGQTGKI